MRASAGLTLRIRGSRSWVWLMGLACSMVGAGRGWCADAQALEQFEKKVRPILVERCHKCHAGPQAKGGLRLDAAAELRKGGESGPVIVAGKPDESLLIRAVRQQDGLAMPPTGKLTAEQISALTAWVAAGAPWPDEVPGTAPPAAAAGVVSPRLPNEGELASHLQLWLRADSLKLGAGEPVPVWPDASGHGRDVTATKGVRADGVGLPGTFAPESTIQRRAAVHFETTTGLAASPDRPVPIHGDAALSILLVVNLQPHEAQPPFDGVLGIGNPANRPGDPGRPLAALVQINRGENHALHFAGGWNHDASAGAGSFQPFYGVPLVISVVKQPGPMRTTTRLFINGDPLGPAGGPLEGRDTVPDIQHRDDIGVYLGKAVSWAGSIRGDIGEVLVYDQALSDLDRRGLESHLGEKYGLAVRSLYAPQRLEFTAEEKSHWAYQPVRTPAIRSSRVPAAHESAIDALLQVQLDAVGLAPAERAARRTLYRRLCLDLTGLPPSPQDIAAFATDDAPDAWSRAVDRLLTNPALGAQWGRHWLDVVRYAETTANDANAVMRYAWRYRNYVIDAWNHDLPYDRFVVEQVAGDLLPATDPLERLRQTTATGWLMVGPKALAETDKEQSRLDIVDDQIDVLGRAVLGLTLSCARCHDHKFDAIRTADYYALAGIFRSTEPFKDESRNASMWWEFPISLGEGAAAPMVMAPKEAAPRDLRIHQRGNRFNLGPLVHRGFPQVLGESPLTIASGSGRLELAQWLTRPDHPLTGRVHVNRIWQQLFGRGLVATSDNFGRRGERPSHPELLDYLAVRLRDSGFSSKAVLREMVLTAAYQRDARPPARAVEVDADNRLLSHFPRRRLAAEQLRDALLAVTGQLDAGAGGSESSDILWKEAEIQDAQRGFAPNRMTPDHAFYTDFRKRSVYLPVVRNMLPDVLALFDAADPNGVTAQRNDSTIPSQSLYLLNSPFVRRLAQALARELLASGGSDDERLAAAHVRVFGRAATAAELAEGRDFLATVLASSPAQAQPAAERLESAWANYCQTLLCQNEFLYYD